MKRDCPSCKHFRVLRQDLPVDTDAPIRCAIEPKITKLRLKDILAPDAPSDCVNFEPLPMELLVANRLSGRYARE